MMMALHRRALPILSGLALFVGVTLSVGAQGTVQITNIPQPVTQREFYAVLASGFVFVAIGTAGVVKFMFSTTLADLRGIVQELRESVAKFEDRLYNHNESTVAHAAAAEHNHAPIDRKIDAVKTELEEFMEFCRTHQCAFGSRNPADSPHPRRFTDSQEFNAAEMKLRGPKP